MEPGDDQRYSEATPPGTVNCTLCKRTGYVQAFKILDIRALVKSTKLSCR